MPCASAWANCFAAMCVRRRCPRRSTRKTRRGPATNMDFLRRLFLENFWLQVFAILLAFTLWIMVHRDPITEVAIEVPVEFHNIPLNVEITSDTVYRSTVRLRGPERVIHQLSPSDVHEEIDL